MKKREIVVDIAPGGSVSIEAVGFKGAECEKATEFLDKALGKIESTKRKPEYYSREQKQEARQ